MGSDTGSGFFLSAQTQCSLAGELLSVTSPLIGMRLYYLHFLNGCALAIDCEQREGDPNSYLDNSGSTVIHFFSALKNLWQSSSKASGVNTKYGHLIFLESYIYFLG